MPITTVTVNGATSTWQDTGVVLNSGDALSVAASGSCQIATIAIGLGHTGPIVGIGGSPYYGLPEGAYGPTFPSTHALDPSSVEPISFLSSANQLLTPASNTVPFSLVLAIAPAGYSFSGQVATALQPNRATIFTAAEISAAALAGGPWHVWAIFSDWQYSDNAGSITVLLQNLPAGSNQMSDRFTITNGVQFGLEATPGTLVAAERRMMGMNVVPEIMASFLKHRTSGFKRADLEIIEKEWSAAKYDGVALYNEIGYLLGSLVAKPVSQVLTSPVYQHTFQSSSTVLDTLNSYTFEYGSNVGMERFSYGMIPSMDWKMSRDDIKISGDMYGYQLKTSVNDGISLTPGGNEVQTLTLTGASGGTYALSFNGATTGPIAWNAAASAIQTALQGLSTIGASNVTVSGSGPYTITFAAALAGQQLPLITANGAALTGSSPTAVVTEATKGGLLQFTKIPILPGDVSVYLSSVSLSDVISNSANLLTRQFVSDWSVKNRHSPFWTQNSGVPSFTGIAEDEKMEEMIQLTLGTAPGNKGSEFIPVMRAGTTQWLRIQATSQEYNIPTTATPYSFMLAACVKVDKVNPFKDDQGIWCASYDLQMTPDPTNGNIAYLIQLVNDVAAYN